LEEIEADGKPTLMVFNKIDRLKNREAVRPVLDRYPNAVAISAQTGEGLTEFLAELGAVLRPLREFVELRVPHGEAAVIARLHSVAQVVERDYEGEVACFKARVPPHCLREFQRYIVTHLDTGPG
jgi:GTP-binding protein HflX